MLETLKKQNNQRVTSEFDDNRDNPCPECASGEMIYSTSPSTRTIQCNNCMYRETEEI